jgi:hypothetical protein
MMASEHSAQMTGWVLWGYGLKMVGGEGQQLASTKVVPGMLNCHP